MNQIATNLSDHDLISASLKLQSSKNSKNCCLIRSQNRTGYVLSIWQGCHLLKLLVYFEDAENQPMPTMLQNVSWEDVKKKIVFEVSKTQSRNGLPA